MQYNPVSPMYPYNIPSGTNDIQGVRWVSSFDEVRAASVPFGRAIFMNSNEDVFYIKDSNGNLNCFKFEKIPTPVPENFVTRTEFEELRSKYEQLIQSTNSANQSQPAGNYATDAAVQGNPGASQGSVLPDSSFNGNV